MSGAGRLRVLAAALAVAILAFATAGKAEPVADCPRAVPLSRAMWVWTTSAVLDDARERALFLAALAEGRFTDVYLYLQAGDYQRREPELRVLLDALAGVGVRAWGLEGWRGYFSDGEGPAGLYAAAEALLAYNRRNAVRFAGFQSDLEPQDGQGVGRARFHNGLPDSRLTPAQRSEREALLAEWLAIHEALRARLSVDGLAYGAAVPAWLDDYYGEPVATSFQGSRGPVMQRLMALVDEYVVMSYSTRPAKVLERVGAELAYADTLKEKRPRVLFALETHAGAGRGVSYADTRPPNRKEAVLADFETITVAAARHASFAGGAIHDWAGWRDLPGAAGTKRDVACGKGRAAGSFQSDRTIRPARE